MENNSNYGRLITKDIKLYRMWFKQMVDLQGIYVIFRAPKADKHYTTYAEINSSYEKPQKVGCIFEEHPEQQTLKKLGWAAELQESASVIHVPYDLEGIQQGALFIIPSGIDNATGRLFRVVKLSNIMIYPASIACQIVPEYENTYEEAQSNFKHNNFTLLADDDDDVSQAVRTNTIIYNNGEDNT